jgi:hypothetical protein
MRGERLKSSIFAGPTDPLPGIYPDGTSDQFGPVVGVEERIIRSGIFLWQKEGFLKLALAVQVANVELCVSSIVPPAAEYNPSVVQCPGMVTFGIIGIYIFWYLNLAGTQIDQT